MGRDDELVWLPNPLPRRPGDQASLRDHHAAQCSTKSGDPFKFANEKTGDNGDVVELPNPLPPRRAIN